MPPRPSWYRRPLGADVPGGQDRHARGGIERIGAIGLQQIDPPAPVRAVDKADVEPPASPVRPDEGAPLDRRRVEVLLARGPDRLEARAVPADRDPRLPAALRLGPAQAVAQVEALVRPEGARRTGPPPRAAAERLHDRLAPPRIEEGQRPDCEANRKRCRRRERLTASRSATNRSRLPSPPRPDCPPRSSPPAHQPPRMLESINHYPARSPSVARGGGAGAARRAKHRVYLRRSGTRASGNCTPGSRIFSMRVERGEKYGAAHSPPRSPLWCSARRGSRGSER